MDVRDGKEDGTEQPDWHGYQVTLPLISKLGRYVNGGQFRIDNNLIENAIRPLALGRKNSQCCGNNAAVRAAIVYSLVDTRKDVGKDPHECMEDVLIRTLGNEDNRKALRELLHDRCAKPTN